MRIEKRLLCRLAVYHGRGFSRRLEREKREGTYSEVVEVFLARVQELREEDGSE